MKKLFTLLLIVVTAVSYGQQEFEIKSDSTSTVQAKKKRIRFGSGFGLNFLGGTNISVTPNAVYTLDNGLAFGLGLNYSYSKVNEFKNNTYGGSLLSFYNVPKTKIQLSGEYELLQSKIENNNLKTTRDSSSLFFGATYSFGKIALGFRYNVLYDDDSPYTQAFLPVVRIGF